MLVGFSTRSVDIASGNVIHADYGPARRHRGQLWLTTVGFA